LVVGCVCGGFFDLVRCVVRAFVGVVVVCGCVVGLFFGCDGDWGFFGEDELDELLLKKTTLNKNTNHSLNAHTKNHNLINNPMRVAVGGKGLKEGLIEVKLRTEPKEGTRKVPVAEAGKTVIDLTRGLLDAARKAADAATA